LRGPRIFNGDLFLQNDETSDGSIPLKLANPDDVYFTESFLANFQDSQLFKDPFNNKDKEAN